MFRYLKRVLSALSFIVAVPAWAVPAGTVEFVLGDVRIRDAKGMERRAAKGTVVEVGETVIAASNANAQMRMIDNAFLAVRPDTELEITDYRYSGKADGSENALLRLVRGTMRAFTGRITNVRKDRFLTRTVTSTIGVRGSGNVAHYSPALGTINHTIEGSHVTTSVGAQGQVIGTPVITNAGQTVQVQLNQPPVRVPTPPFILQAATGAPKPAPAPAPGQTSSESTSEGSGRATSTSDAALVAETAVPVATQTAAETVTAESAPTTTTTLTGTSSSLGAIDLTSQEVTAPSGTPAPITPGVIPGAPTLVPTGVDVISSYFYNAGAASVFSAITDFGAFDDVVTFTGPNGNFKSGTSVDGQGHTLTVGGDTSGASTVTTLANGISFGRYGGVALSGGGPALQVSGADHQTAFTGRNVVGTLHWISAPGAAPFLASAVLTGTATYSLLGASSPTDQNNVAGTLNTASLGFNFDNQSMSAALDITMPGSRHWTANASNVALGQDGRFFANSGATGTYAHRNMTVMLNGGGAFGNISGQLTGTLLNGAILGYNFIGMNPLTSLQEWVNGVAGFGSPSFSTPPSTSPSYYILISSMGSQRGFDVNSGQPAAVPAASVNSDSLVATPFAIQEASRPRFNASGQLMEFDTQLPVVSNISGTTCSPNPCFQNEIPMRVSINPFGAPAVGNIPPMPAISGTAASILDFGSDAATGLQWGRYSGDQFAVVDRVNGSPVGTGNASFGPINHFLLTASQSGATTLPTTGSATYTWVGNTNPTDSTGAVGTLTAAALAANFSSKSVSASVALSVGGRDWTASATNRPILAGTGFQSMAGSSGGLTVTCAGAGCGSTVAGQIVGAFTGATGEGAGIAYTLNSGGVPTSLGGSGVTVGGVAAFRR